MAPKPTISQLEFLVWMSDHPDCYYGSSYGSYTVLQNRNHRFAVNNGKSFSTYVGEDSYKPAKNIAIHIMLQQGWLRNLLQDEIKKMGLTHAWYEHFYEITEEGKRVANEHRHLLEKHLLKEQQKRNACDRLVIISDSHRFSEKLKYTALCRVTKETNKRVYVDVVKKAKGVGYIYSMGGGRYISRDLIAVDNATEEMFDKLSKAEHERNQWIKQVEQQLKDEIVPIKKRYEDRIKQDEQRFEEEVKEIIG